MQMKIRAVVILFFLLWTVYFALFWARVFFIKDGGIWVGNLNTWGDWPVHFTMGAVSAYRELIPKYHPLLAFSPFTYAFLSNVFSGILVRMGVPFLHAFIVPTFFACLLTIYSLYVFYRKISLSASAALLAATVFLLNGGLGFFYFLRTLKLAPSLDTLLNPPHQYTHMPEYFIQWINVLQIFASQRTVTFGLPITLGILLATYMLFFSNQRISTKKKLFCCAGLGVLTGILPILHIHLFAALSVTLTWWACVDILQPSKQRVQKLLFWGTFGSLALVFSIPILLKYFLSADTVPLYIWWPRWYAHGGQQNMIVFWLWNWGLIPFLAFAGFFLLPKVQKYLFLPFFLFFLAVNLFVYSPFIWENTKFLVFVSIGFSYLAALVLLKMFHHSPLWRVVAIGIFLLSIASGSIEAVRMQNMKLDAREMVSKEELGLAYWVRKNTPKDAMFLVGDKHTHFVPTLTGRPIVMGFRGWLKSYGLRYSQTEQDVAAMYKGEQLDTLLKKYQVQYIVVGPYEEEVWGAKENTFKRFSVATQTQTYTIFIVTNQ